MSAMKNLLVTGGCGFIGSNFIRYLLDESDFSGRIINLDKLTYAGNPKSLLDVEQRHAERYVLEVHDICDAAELKRIFRHYQIDGVCHFAAESHVDRSIHAPGDFIKTNIMGTFQLLEEVRALNGRVSLFHHVSTDEVFGSLGEEGYFTEKTAYKPNSPYSASKASSDHLVRAYHKTYGIPITISNCSNNYGPYQFPEKLIPLILLNAYEGKKLPVYGDGSNVRDWLYVRDHCTAIWKIMQTGVRGQTYCVGGKCDVPNLQVVHSICDNLDQICGELNSGGRRNLIEFVADRPGHDWRYAIDCSKLEQELGWQPAETFESGLRKTIEWYLEHSEWVQSVKSGEYQEWIARHYKDSAK